MKIGLVLEGGGMRGLYTIGVLDYFMENNLKFPYVTGVSAGACNGISYVSGQIGRSLRVNTEYISDKRYISFENFVKTKSLFGMDFLFDTIPNHLEIFDNDAFLKSDIEFTTGVTNVITGKSEFFPKEAVGHNIDILKASSSIPLFSPMVKINGNYYLDGGTSCPIPIKQAFKDGCDKVIVVLTREREYLKSPEKFRFIYKKAFSDYPKMIELLDKRHNIYNETLEFIRECEKDGKAIVIAPKNPPAIDRFEKNKEKLIAFYNEGKQDTKEKMKEISQFME